MEKKLYAYEGVVLMFEQVVATNWRATTWATSPAKARANLTYRFKQETGRVAGCRITLPGEIREVF